jgi:hypothetical protein
MKLLNDQKSSELVSSKLRTSPKLV